MSRLRNFVCRAAFAAFVLALPAMAHATPGAGGGAPPVPSLNRSPHPVIGFGIMFVLLVAVVAVSLMPSKRGHQD